MKYNKTVGMVSIQIDTKRIDDNVRRAQDLLDQQVLNDISTGSNEGSDTDH